MGAWKNKKRPCAASWGGPQARRCSTSIDGHHQQLVFRRYVGVPVKWVLCRYRLQQAALEIESHPGDRSRRPRRSAGLVGPGPFHQRLPHNAWQHSGRIRRESRKLGKDVDSRELAFAGAAEQARMLADGTITAPELLELYLERIARLDRELRSFRAVLTDSARQ